jgi:hypothetical protein
MNNEEGNKKMIKLDISGEHVAVGVVLAVFVYIVFNVTSCVNNQVAIENEKERIELKTNEKK